MDLRPSRSEADPGAAVPWLVADGQRLQRDGPSGHKGASGTRDMQLRPYGSVGMAPWETRGRPYCEVGPSFPQLWPHPQPPAQLLRPAHSEGSGSALGLVLLSHVRGTAPGAHPTAPVLFSRADACLSLRIQEDGLLLGLCPNPTTQEPRDPGQAAGSL